jgi:predicted LPLAT superfamily acyltransferase
LNGHWGQRAELGAAWGLRLLFWARRTLGRTGFSLLLAPVLAYFFLTRPSRRRDSLDYLRRVHAAGGLSHAPGWRDAWAHMARFSHGTVEKLLAWDPKAPAPALELEGAEHADALLNAGRGFLLIGSHLGNLEAARALSRRRGGTRVNVLVHTRHAERFNRLLAELAPESQARLFQVSELGPAEAIELKTRVDRGEVLLIAGDRVPLGPGLRTEAGFLGGRAEFPAGPWVLAHALGCPVLLFYCSGGDGRFRVRFEPFADPLVLPRQGRAEALRGVAQRYADSLQAQCLRSPLEWGNFYPFWKAEEPV